jgi:hypothetical protein
LSSRFRDRRGGGLQAGAGVTRRPWRARGCGRQGEVVVGVAPAGEAYVVQDAGPRISPGETQVEYPYTLRGIEDALADAVSRSIEGPAQVIKVVSGDQGRVIRGYEHGREVPVTL